MGLPEIIVEFRTAGATALRRSSRGSAAIIVAGTGADLSFTAPSQADAAALDARVYKLVRLCFLGGPSRVHLIRAGSGDDALARAARAAAGGWLCAPDLSAAEVVAFVKAQRALGAGLRAVVADAEAPDCEGIVNFCAAGLQLTLDGATAAIPAADYCARIAGLLAGLRLDRSATYLALPEVADFTDRPDPDGDIEGGRLILTRGGSGARLARAVTSLTTLTAAKGAAFRKIKIVEGVDLIRADIRGTFESDYIGRVINDYDSKLLLVTAVNGYFAQLAGTVLDGSGANECGIDLAAQTAWLQSQGLDTSALSEQQILSANTGSSVFLSASVRFADAMEDLHFTVSM